MFKDVSSCQHAHKHTWKNSFLQASRVLMLASPSIIWISDLRCHLKVVAVFLYRSLISHSPRNISSWGLAPSGVPEITVEELLPSIRFIIPIEISPSWARISASIAKLSLCWNRENLNRIVVVVPNWHF